MDHLLATSASGSYAVLLAAILPCYWLYAEVGQQLHAAYVQAGARSDHPYAAWLKTYADEEFAAATRKAIDFTDAAAAGASAQERKAMVEAFAQSCRYETAFFDAPGSSPKQGFRGGRVEQIHKAPARRGPNRSITVQIL